MAAGCPLEIAPLPRKAKIFLALVIALQIYACILGFFLLV